MKNSSRVVIIVLTLVLAAQLNGVSAATLAGEKGEHIEGRLASAGCNLNHKAVIKNDRKGCAVFCARQGLPVGVMTKEGKFIPLLVRTVEIAEYVEETVRVNGQMSSGLFLVDKIEMLDGDEWKEIEGVTFGSLL
jgi:hypothetical protein